MLCGDWATLDSGYYKVDLMQIPPERMLSVFSGFFDIRRPHALLGLFCLVVFAVLLSALSLMRESPVSTPGAISQSTDLSPPDADRQRLTSGAGRPLAPGEIGTVLSVLFKDPPPPAEAAKEPASPSQAPSPQAPSPSAVPGPPDLERIKAVQSRLAALGFAPGDEGGVWGAQSRQALRDFKIARHLPPDDVLDEATEKALFGDSPRNGDTFAGVWAPNLKACSPQTNQKGLLPAVINREGAWAGDVSCSFRNGRRDGDGWRFAATCSDARKRWGASVKLTVAGDVLTWSSERGSQKYVRCVSAPG